MRRYGECDPWAADEYDYEIREKLWDAEVALYSLNPVDP